jgi:hypothetical protein
MDASGYSSDTIHVDRRWVNGKYGPSALVLIGLKDTVRFRDIPGIGAGDPDTAKVTPA